MQFNTKISDDRDGVHAVYGKAVTALMQEATFTEVIFLLFKGVLPTQGERRLLDTMLVAAAEHGVEAPSLYVPRVSVASGNSVHVAMAAGILAIGEVHGGAGEAAANLLARPEGAEDIVAEYLTAGKRLPGFGHKVYRAEDPRAKIIYEQAKKTALPLKAFEKAYAIENMLATQKGTTFPLNIDGAFAAGILALGLPPTAAKALFVVARVAGMGAHAIEEAAQSCGYKRLTDE